MRRLRIACGVVALAALLWTVPVTAQPEPSWPTGWGAFAGGVVDWAVGLWRVVAGSETEAALDDSMKSTELDGSGDTSFGSVQESGEKTPALDPDG